MFHTEDSEDPTFSETLELDLWRRRAEHRGPEAPAGPDRARRGEGRVPRVARRSSTPRPPRAWGTATTRPSPRASRPPTRRARTTTAKRGKPRRAGGHRRRGTQGRSGDRDARGRHRDRARPRPRRDRRDHQLHEHVEPVGDGRRRAAGEEGGRAGPGEQALGEDLAGARLDGRHRLPRPGRARPSTSTSSASTSSATAARPASATPARCPRRSRRPSNDERPRGLLGALGQPQLRGPDQPGRAQQLPGVAAALRRLRAGRAGWTSTSSSEPLGEDSDGEPVYLRDIWPTSEEIKQTVADAVRSEMFTKSYADVFTGDERWQRARHPRGRPLRVARLDLRPQAARSSRAWTPSRTAARADRGRARAGRARRQRHDRPHLAGRRDQEGQPGGQVADRPRASRCATSTPTARAAATTR